MARERGLAVDVAGFEKLMEEQRSARAKHRRKKKSVLKREISKSGRQNSLVTIFWRRGSR